MENKRIGVHVESLSSELRIIEALMRANSQNLVKIAQELTPLSYPLIGYDDDRFHIGKTSLCINAVLLRLKKDLTKITKRQWDQIVDRYNLIPRSRDQAKIEVITYNDEMVSASEYIAEWLTAHEIQIPFIYSRHGVSHKVIAAVAIIYVARLLDA